MISIFPNVTHYKQQSYHAEPALKLKSECSMIKKDNK